MKSKSVLGRKIVEIRQTRLWNNQTGNVANIVTAIVLDNGIELRPVTEEFDGEYGTDFVIARTRKDKK